LHLSRWILVPYNTRLESSMYARFILVATVLLAGFVVACGTVPGPSDTVTGGGSCVTDLSCSFGEECDGSACAPIAPALRPYIQTASCLLRAPVDANEPNWRAAHYDLLIGVGDADGARAVNPNARLFEYMLARYNRYDRAGTPKTAMQWATAHGYDGEDFYLHYKEDTYVPTWEGRTIVPGYPAGMVPGWNPGGGGNPASATSRDQSRVVGYYNGGEPWYFANVADPGYRQFLIAYTTGLLDGTWWNNQAHATGSVDGVMIDEAIWYPVYGEGLLAHSTEYYGVPVNDDHPYTHAIENLYPGLASDAKDYFGTTKDIMPNYGHVLFLNYANRCAQDIQKSTPWIWGEVWTTYTGASSPTSGVNRCITEDDDYDQAVRQIILQTRAGGRRVVGARDYSNGTSGTDRGKLLSLGLYYLVHNSHTFYMYETLIGHAGAGHVSTWAYNPAVDYDIGQPDQIPNGAVDFEGRSNTKEHYLFASGPDPVNPSLTYHVYARRFTNALVLVKLLPAGSTTDDTSITTHTLDGTYAPLNVDGTIGAPITQASIRNNEALILIRL
jgi:hypothetical protein